MYEYEINYKEDLDLLKISEAKKLAISDFNKIGIPIILEEQVLNLTSI